MLSSLCRDCLGDAMHFASPHKRQQKEYYPVICGGWLHEGDFEAEAYELVQDRQARGIRRYLKHADWQRAVGNKWPTMAKLISDRVKVLGEEEDPPKE